MAVRRVEEERGGGWGLGGDGRTGREGEGKGRRVGEEWVGRWGLSVGTAMTGEGRRTKGGKGRGEAGRSTRVDGA